MKTIDEIWAAMAAIIDGASGRSLTPDEVAQYRALEGELEAAQANAEVLKRHAAYNTVVVPAGVPAPAPRPAETIEDAFRSYLRTAQPNADITALAVTGPGDLGARNAQGTVTGPAGGYLVPEGFRTKIVERMKSVGGLAEQAEQLTTETGQTLPWPVIDDTANAGEVVDESAGNVTGADVDFDFADLGAWEYQAGGAGGEPIKLPWALMQDAAFDVEKLLSRLLGLRLARAFAPHLISGSGVKQPKGILLGITGIEAAGSTPDYADLVNLKTGTDTVDGVDQAYWPACKWLLNQVSLGLVWKIEDSHGDPIWRPSVMGGALESGTLLGHPIVIDNDMPDFVGTNGADDNWIVFGDLTAAYVTRKVRDIAVVVNPWSSANKRQNEYTAWMRADGRPQDTNAYSVGAGHTT